ncbi:hypothetical protein JY651_31190 [Pyxidicoccus parkwayensis]|uniref:Lipoprotein MlpA n=1 Tax=Pyxidicoccus parkwayensis TaxID=2813578 RepID=A0ABX7NMV8_9BACT|nr:hypothetical protein [Pyxidicoccus parkwaysis]QSQ19738.1 hypothetical protein JY651_31190 [Pyxidicoccus parkwaysis]
MTKNILKTVLAVVSMGSLMAGCNFDQPEAGCFVQDATNWYAKYDLVSEPKRADGTACTAQPPIGERLGIYKFVDPDHLDKPTLTIRPTGLVSLGARDSGDPSRQTATGQFSAEPDGDDFCGANNFTAATVEAAATSTAAATTVTYEFSNVRVYSAPSSPGTQMTGELKWTKDGCTSTYVVRALWPAAICIPGSTEAATSCGEGSGLNPDFAAECASPAAPNCGATGDQVAAGFTGCCIASKSIPSFK